MNRNELRMQWLASMSHSEQEQLNLVLQPLGVHTGEALDNLAVAIAKLAHYGQALEGEAQAMPEEARA